MSSALAEQIKGRYLENGGFRSKEGSSDRPDATAWAIMALMAGGQDGKILSAPRSRLAAGQLPDGRVSVSQDHPEAFWPTSLAILAWHHSPEHRDARSRAVQFLLHTAGQHWQRQADAPYGHDTALKGWPWIAGTHSWSEPTALALIALQSAGFGGHARAQEAERLLLDRQLPRGGWNYGNTLMFGQELHPLPEDTGMVLEALSRRVPRESTQQSLSYLHTRIAGLRTPRSLGWGLLGLSAWGERPRDADTWIAESLARQERYGGYDTVSLSLLLVSLLAPGGLASLYRM